MSKILATFLLLPALAAARAQSFNVDLGGPTSIPSARYGASIGQPGVWNCPQLPPGAWLLPPTALVDLAGGATAATIASPDPDYQFGTDLGTGDFGALLGDWWETDSGSIDFHVGGLAAGDYEVTTYATVADCTGATTSVSVTGAAEGLLLSTTAFGTDHAAGVTYVRHRVPIAGGTLVIRIAAVPGGCGDDLGACNGLQITRLDGGSSAICSGDGSGTACPCGNAGGPGRGCASSFDANGALLVANGIASVTSDTLILTATSVSTSAILFFQGTQAVHGSAGGVFGDGLRCAGGTTIRIASVPASGNMVSYPPGFAPRISVLGAIPPVGGTRIYQAWYRNAASFCTPSTFNLTNALRTTWRP